MMKDIYVGTIQSVGFRDVRIMDETLFPIDLMVNDPTAAAIIENQGIAPEDVEEIADSVLSIKVQAIKPNGTA